MIEYRTMREPDAKPGSHGASWVKLRDVREGDVLVADGNFVCIDAGDTLTVARDFREGTLYVQCRCGHHYLADDRDARGRVTGLSRPACGRKAA